MALELFKADELKILINSVSSYGRILLKKLEGPYIFKFFFIFQLFR